MRKLLTGVVLVLALGIIYGCSKQPSGTETSAVALETAAVSEVQTEAETEEPETTVERVDIQILATSDLHGKFYPWAYSLDAESPEGSMLQLATAIRERRTENTLLLDAGDTIQDNSADLFLDEEVHPMIAAMNDLAYDAWTTGNHEYNFGMDVLKRIISQHKDPLILANVKDPEGKLLGQPYQIFERGGIRIGVIGIVSPYIAKWDEANLKGYEVLDPVVECRKAIEALKDQTDILILLAHEDIENEYNMPNSGVRDMANACPELDLIIASHGHRRISGEEINGVLIVENQNQAQTMAEVHLIVEKTKDRCSIAEKTSDLVILNDYASDPELAEVLLPYHEKGLEKSHEVIGRLEGGALTPENEIQGVPITLLQDTALVDLVNKVMLYYTDADVSATALTDIHSRLEEGDIRACDVALIYKYANTLYKFRMNGAQLKRYLEWSAAFYHTFEEGDLTIAFCEDRAYYNYDMLQGVNYIIDISMPEGQRIQNLTWPDGTPVEDEDSFTIAVNNYRSSNQFQNAGIVFEEGDMPELLETEIGGKGIRDLILDYIKDVKNGVITPVVDNNWYIVGNDWDEELHEKAVSKINAGELSVTVSETGKSVNTHVIRESDLK